MLLHSWPVFVLISNSGRNVNCTSNWRLYLNFFLHCIASNLAVKAAIYHAVNLYFLLVLTKRNFIAKKCRWQNKRINIWARYAILWSSNTPTWIVYSLLFFLLFFCCAFDLYLMSLSSMIRIWVAGDRCKWRAYFGNKMSWPRLEPQIF